MVAESERSCAEVFAKRIAEGRSVNRDRAEIRIEEPFETALLRAQPGVWLLRQKKQVVGKARRAGDRLLTHGTLQTQCGAVKARQPLAPPATRRPMPIPAWPSPRSVVPESTLPLPRAAAPSKE